LKFKDIRKFIGTSLEDVLKYLRTDLESGTRNLLTGLENLSFQENFDGFLWSGDIASGATTTITNPLGQIPRYRVVLKAEPLTSGAIAIDDSLSPWTENAVYIRNSGAVTARTIIYFMR